MITYSTSMLVSNDLWCVHLNVTQVCSILNCHSTLTLVHLRYEMPGRPKMRKKKIRKTYFACFLHAMFLTFLTLKQLCSQLKPYENEPHNQPITDGQLTSDITDITEQDIKI